MMWLTMVSTGKSETLFLSNQRNHRMTILRWNSRTDASIMHPSDDFESEIDIGDIGGTEVYSIQNRHMIGGRHRLITFAVPQDKGDRFVQIASTMSLDQGRLEIVDDDKPDHRQWRIDSLNAQRAQGHILVSMVLMAV